MERGSRLSRFVWLLAAGLLLSACGARETQDEPTLEATSAPSTKPIQTTDTEPAQESEVIEGLFDVGGHRLYMKCEGLGSLTVIYLHGYSHNQGDAGARGGTTIQSEMKDWVRFCVYDRRNVGKSDEVPEEYGLYTGKGAVSDLHNLLEAAHVEPPYVLLAASFGGLIAHSYAATFPDEVVGMVLLDATVPAELELDDLLPEDMRFRHDEDVGSDELLDQLAVREEALQLNAPDIPVTYMLATPSGWPTMGVPEWDAAILPTIHGYIDGFSQGKWVEVHSAHCIECFAPEAVIQELDDLIGRIRGDAASASAHPFAGETAWIAYQTNRGGSEGVWLIHPDGTEDHQIATDFAGSLLLPDWSPDGTKLAMASRDTGGVEPLFEYDLATETYRQLFACDDPCVGDDEPAYSPDGTKVAFIRYLGPFTSTGPSDCGLWIGDIATGEVTQITSNTSGCLRESSPRWSPDGSKIAYYRELYDDTGSVINAIFVIAAEGGEEQQLTDWELVAGYPEWSPNGEWILFATHPLWSFNHDAVVSNLYRMRPDGSGIEQLTFYETPQIRANQPRYTPDGKWIVFTAVTSSSRSLWAIPAQGGEPVVIAQGGIYTHGTWQPGSTK